MGKKGRMKVRGLDGKEYRMSLTGFVPSPSDERARSSLHLRARRLLAGLFPLERRLEEVCVPGPDRFYLDFFLPGRRLVVEVQGRQHYERSSLFHETEEDFALAKERDRRKALWCERNNLRLIGLPFDEDDERWRERTVGA